MDSTQSKSQRVLVRLSRNWVNLVRRKSELPEDPDKKTSIEIKRICLLNDISYKTWKEDLEEESKVKVNR